MSCDYQELLSTSTDHLELLSTSLDHLELPSTSHDHRQLPSMSYRHWKTPSPDVDPAEELSSHLPNFSLSGDVSQSTQPLHFIEQFSQQSDLGSSKVQSSQSVNNPSYVVFRREPIQCEMIEMLLKIVAATQKYCCVCFV